MGSPSVSFLDHKHKSNAVSAGKSDLMIRATQDSLKAVVVSEHGQFVPPVFASCIKERQMGGFSHVCRTSLEGLGMSARQPEVDRPQLSLRAQTLVNLELQPPCGENCQDLAGCNPTRRRRDAQSISCTTAARPLRTCIHNIVLQARTSNPLETRISAR